MLLYQFLFKSYLCFYFLFDCSHLTNLQFLKRRSDRLQAQITLKVLFMIQKEAPLSWQPELSLRELHARYNVHVYLYKIYLKILYIHRHIKSSRKQNHTLSDKNLFFLFPPNLQSLTYLQQRQWQKIPKTFLNLKLSKYAVYPISGNQYICLVTGFFCLFLIHKNQRIKIEKLA